MFYPEERVALFIDGANLYAAARAMQSKGHALAFSGRLAPEIGAMLATAGFCHRVPDRADGLSNALFDLLPAPAAGIRSRT